MKVRMALATLALSGALNAQNVHIEIQLTPFGMEHVGQPSIWKRRDQ